MSGSGISCATWNSAWSSVKTSLAQPGKHSQCFLKKNLTTTDTHNLSAIGIMRTCGCQWVKRRPYLQTRSAFYPRAVVTSEVLFQYISLLAIHVIHRYECVLGSTRNGQVNFLPYDVATWLFPKDFRDDLLS